MAIIAPFSLQPAWTIHAVLFRKQPRSHALGLCSTCFIHIGILYLKHFCSLTAHRHKLKQFPCEYRSLIGLSEFKDFYSLKSNPNCSQAITHNIFTLDKELQYMIMNQSLHVKRRHGLCHFVTTNNSSSCGEVVPTRIWPECLCVHIQACMLDEPSFSWSGVIKTEKEHGVIAVIWHRGCLCPPIKVLPQPSSAFNVIREDVHRQIHIDSRASLCV